MKRPLEGWVKGSHDGMDRVRFELGPNGRLDAYLNGEIWDLSDDPMDFVERIGDRVYTWRRENADGVDYLSPEKLSEWLKG